MKLIQLLVLTILLQAMSVLAETKSQTVGLFVSKPNAYQGYTLFTPRHFNETYLIDMQGDVVHKWHHPTRNENAKLLENGLLLTTINIQHPAFERIPGPHGEVQLLDWDGELVWRYQLASENQILHHDILPLPNGNYLMSTFEVKSRQQMIDAGRNPALLETDKVLVETIIEVKPKPKQGGDIVWQWSVWDHLIQDFDSTKNNYGDVKAHPEKMDINQVRRPSTPDWNHVSGLDYNPTFDQVMITFHGSNEIIIIDHSTNTDEAKGNKGGRYGKGGGFLYRYGNPQIYQGGTEDDQVFNVIHNAHWIPAGLPREGQVMVLNNRFAEEQSSLEIYQLPNKDNGEYEFPAEDGSTLSKLTPTYTFREFYTRNMGGMQQLPNGNILIDEAVKGRFIEVSPQGEIVWEYINPVVNDGAVAQGDIVPPNFSGDLLNEVFRVTRIDKNSPIFADKKLKAQGPLELSEGARDDNPARTPKPPSSFSIPRQNTGRTQGQNIDINSLNLNKEQVDKVTNIFAEQDKQRRQIVKNSKGNRQTIGRAMGKLNRDVAAQLKPILTPEQYAAYLQQVAERSPRR